jgi:seryl-tRNA synthetase
MRILIALLLLTTPALAEVYRVVEDGVVQEYNVAQTTKDRAKVIADINTLNADLATYQRRVTEVQSDITNLTALLDELPEPVVEPVVEQPVVDETVYGE